MLRPTNDDDNVQYQMRTSRPNIDRQSISDILEKIANHFQTDYIIVLSNSYKYALIKYNNLKAEQEKVIETINNILAEKGLVYSQLKTYRKQQKQLDEEIASTDKKILYFESNSLVKELIKLEQEKGLKDLFSERENNLKESINKLSEKKLVVAERNKRVPFKNKDESNKIECPKCHAKNNNSLMYCYLCGTNLHKIEPYKENEITQEKTENDINISTTVLKNMNIETTDKNKKIKIAKICCCFIPPLLIIVLFFTFTFGSCNSQNAISEIQLVGISENVSPGSRAYIKVQGKPNTEYSITVEYKSGYSEAEGLYSKNSDNSGYISWNWKVGTKTSEGTYPVTITNEDTFAYETFYFSVK